MLPVLRRYAALCIPCVGVLVLTMHAAGAAEPAALAPTGSASFASWRARAMAMHPQAAVDAAALDAARAAAHTAGRWSDPSLGVEVGRSRHPGLSDATTWRIELRQDIDWRGRNAALAEAGRSDLRAAEQTQLLARAELLAEVDRALIAWAAAVEVAALAHSESAAVADMATAAQRRQVAQEGGSDASLRALIEQQKSTLAAQRADRQCAAAQAVVASWCGPLPNDLSPSALLPLLPEPLPATASAIAELHDAARFNAARAQELAAERSAQRDIQVGVFVGSDRDERQIGLAVEIPLPLWNGGQAEAQVAAARRDAAQIRVDVLRRAQRLIQLRAAHDSASAAAVLHQHHLLRASAALVAATTQRYLAGVASLDEVVNARRERIALHLAAIAARREAAELRLDYAALIGVAP